MGAPLESFQSRSFRLACDVVALYTKLEEAGGAQSRRDLTAKFSIALKETREARYWLRLFVATDLASPDAINPTLTEVNTLLAILTTARRRLATNDAGKK